MFKIIEKKQLSAGVFYMRVAAPEIARNRKAGQFVIVQVEPDFGERIPLTIADANAEEGWIALVFQAVGATTYKLSLMEAGQELPAILGPLGNPSKIEKYDAPVVVVGGGFGVAPCYPVGSDVANNLAFSRIPLYLFAETPTLQDSETNAEVQKFFDKIKFNGIIKAYIGDDDGEPVKDEEGIF